MMMQNPFMNPMSMGGGMPIPQPPAASLSLGNTNNNPFAQGAPITEVRTARGAKSATTDASSKASKRGAKKKIKGKPKRPLSAYNLFFRDERERILNDISKKEDGDDTESNKDEEQEEEGGGGAEGDANTTGTKPKKKPHGKIGFESLAKLIGKRWQELESVEVDKYKKLAEEDAKRYKAEMEVFLTKGANDEEIDGAAKKRKLNDD